MKGNPEREGKSPVRGRGVGREVWGNRMLVPRLREKVFRLRL